MNTHTFSFGAMIKSGWQIFKPNLKLIWLAGIVTLIIQIILQIISSSTSAGGNQSWIASIIVFIFVFLIGAIIKLGWSKVFLGLVRHDVVTWNTFKTDSKVWIQYIKVSLWYLGYIIVYFVIAALPFLILYFIFTATNIQVLQVIFAILSMISMVVVLAYVGIKYQFMTFVTLDHPELSSRNVLRKSGALTKGTMWKLLGFVIVLALFNLLGLICIVIGLAFTIPTSRIAMTKVYQFLKEQHEHKA